MSFDAGQPFTETWDELSPSFNTLWKPGSNPVVKALANQIAASRIFGFAFGEFQGSSKAMLFRVTGMGARLPFLFSQCPSSAIVGDMDEAFASAQADLQALRGALAAADATPSQSALLRQQVGPERGEFAALLEAWPVVDAIPSQVARRR